ncbi:hypothetical protein AVEN_209476-1 [Araneus ventricosus]|uniref:Uncharacterized protein n=1 Tax=Araneus ventricosus TaxID=182803 RepID=A0A4Y2HC16_ARAVE|nr:hypothetical protein AVEN_209476-1 [Araneus ventricosus]
MARVEPFEQGGKGSLDQNRNKILVDFPKLYYNFVSGFLKLVSGFPQACFKNSSRNIVKVAPPLADKIKPLPLLQRVNPPFSPLTKALLSTNFKALRAVIKPVFMGWKTNAITTILGRDCTMGQVVHKKLSRQFFEMVSETVCAEMLSGQPMESVAKPFRNLLCYLGKAFCV